ncbi:MAG: hypothetical protein P9L97_05880 [Candidatus Tenebribacter davisii]|nr:hypothetical protein [Candidatus Tenebribacter davisii]
MAKSRKTFKVEDLRKKVNDYNLNSQDKLIDQRTAQSMLLEYVLMETGNYNGLGYLDHLQMAKSRDGISVGMNTDKKGHVLEKYADRFVDTDRSRVYYF